MQLHLNLNGYVKWLVFIPVIPNDFVMTPLVADLPFKEIVDELKEVKGRYFQ